MIRICKPEEVDSLFDAIFPSWAKECNPNAFDMMLDYKATKETFNDMVKSPNADVLILFNKDSIVGVVGIVMFKSPIGAEAMATEHFLYVLSRHRGLGSIRLIKHAKKWAKDKGCSHIIFNASKMASDLHDRVCGLYERLGMKHFETVYIQDIREV